MADNKLNGSADLLAKAMRKVFQEAVEEGVKPLGKRMGETEKRIENLGNELGNFREETRSGFVELNQRIQDSK